MPRCCMIHRHANAAVVFYRLRFFLCQPLYRGFRVVVIAKYCRRRYACSIQLHRHTRYCFAPSAPRVLPFWRNTVSLTTHAHAFSILLLPSPHRRRRARPRSFHFISQLRADAPMSYYFTDFRIEDDGLPRLAFDSHFNVAVGCLLTIINKRAAICNSALVAVVAYMIAAAEGIHGYYSSFTNTLHFRFECAHDRCFASFHRRLRTI